jgi:hypothetical protein
MPEVITCTSCQRKLQVPDNLMGQDVQCPTCGGTFMARPDGPMPSRSEPAPPPPPTRALVRREERFDDDYNDDYDYERRSRRIRRRRHDYEPHRGAVVLTLGLVGLIGMFFFFPICFVGVAAWIMGNVDMAAIRSGRMDPDGESTTNAGRICGMVSAIIGITVILLFVLLFCLYFMCIAGMFGLAASAPPPRRPVGK